MTDNQFNQLFDLVTKSVTGIQRIEKDIIEVKGDISELKDGQKRIEKQMRLNNRVVNKMAGEQLRINDRVLDLEQSSI